MWKDRLQPGVLHVMAYRATQPARAPGEEGILVACQHDGYRDIVTRYDRASALLTYHWRCEACGALLHEANRLRYRPRFAPLPQASHLAGAQAVGPVGVDF